MSTILATQPVGPSYDHQGGLVVFERLEPYTALVRAGHDVAFLNTTSFPDEDQLRQQLIKKGFNPLEVDGETVDGFFERERRSNGIDCMQAFEPSPLGGLPQYHFVVSLQKDGEPQFTHAIFVRNNRVTQEAFIGSNQTSAGITIADRLNESYLASVEALERNDRNDHEFLDLLIRGVEDPVSSYQLIEANPSRWNQQNITTSGLAQEYHTAEYSLTGFGGTQERVFFNLQDNKPFAMGLSLVSCGRDQKILRGPLSFMNVMSLAGASH